MYYSYRFVSVVTWGGGGGGLIFKEFWAVKNKTHAVLVSTSLNSYRSEITCGNPTQYPVKSLGSVVDPHHFYADADADQDLTYDLMRIRMRRF
jgi:hypothetical protein